MFVTFLSLYHLYASLKSTISFQDELLLSFAKLSSLRFLGIRFHFHEAPRGARDNQITMSTWDREWDEDLSAMDFQTHTQKLAERLSHLEYVCVRFKHGQQLDGCWKVTRGTSDVAAPTVEKLPEYAAQEVMRACPFSQQLYYDSRFSVPVIW